jgi:hypothetical protein
MTPPDFHVGHRLSHAVDSRQSAAAANSFLKIQMTNPLPLEFSQFFAATERNPAANFAAEGKR